MSRLTVLQRDGACLREGRPMGHGRPAEWARTENNLLLHRPQESAEPQTRHLATEPH
jgi:hypothetical protein